MDAPAENAHRRVLIACTGFLSPLFSSLALGFKLRAAGYEVCFAAPDGADKRIREVGFDCETMPPTRVDARTGYSPPPENSRLSPGSRQRRRKQAVQAILNEGFADILETVDPDVVLADFELHAPIIQTLASGRPLGLLSVMYLTPPSLKAPPVSSGIIPGRGWRGTWLGILAKWIEFRLRKELKLARIRWTYWGSDFESAQRSLAKQLGVPLKPITTRNGFQWPWSYKLPNLYLLAGEVDLPTDLYDGQRFGGPVALEEFVPQPSNDGCLPFVRSQTKKRILVGFGTLRRPPGQFLEKLVHIARKREDWHFLISHAGDEIAPDPPENFTVVDWFPQYEMLNHADCAIFHGGAGTIGHCLLKSVPMLVYPNGMDGGGHGARVAYHQLGRMGDFADSTAKIEADIDASLSDETYQDNLEALQSRLTRYRTAAQDFVSELIESG